MAEHSSQGAQASQPKRAHPLAALDWGRAYNAPIQMRYSDTDAMGHVNNATYVTYLETARVALMRDLGTQAGDIHTVVARIEVDYLSEIKLGQEVNVQTLTERIGNSSFTLAVRITADGQPCTYARTVLVHLGSEGRPAPLGERAREMLLGFEARARD